LRLVAVVRWGGGMFSRAWALLADKLVAWGPSLTFGLRLWASVCLALYVAFWLELDNAYWAGTSAALVCQPQLGASLRKGWFRMIGTLVGAVAIVVLTACFPQDRLAFLTGLALWGGACAFVATLLRNFAAYSAALAGYSVAIIASDQLGATGGVNGQAFMLAVTRVSEICIGIISAGIVLAGTDFGGARRRLTKLFAGLTAGIATNFTTTLALAGPELPDTQPIRRDFLQRVIALDPLIDQTIGESSQIRYHSPELQSAVDGLITALSGWRTVANHAVRLSHSQAQTEAAAVLRHLPSELQSLGKQTEALRWLDDPTDMHLDCEAAASRLLAFPAGTPSQRLLADNAAAALAGLSHAFNGLALLVADPARPASHRRGIARVRVPDWLPALVNAGRAFVTIAAVALFWIVTAWPNGATAITWAAISVILLSLRADQAYAAALRFVVGNALAAVCAAVLAFAVLPQLQTFAGFSIALGAYLVPVGVLMAQQWQAALFAPMAANLVPLLAPANQMTYDTVQFYNSTLALVGGSTAAVLGFRLLPPLSPGFRACRLLALSLRDLRGLAGGHMSSDWEGRVRGRLSAMPMEATPLQRAQLLAAHSAGAEIIRLRPLVRRFGLGVALEDALAAMAEGRSTIAIARLQHLDDALAGDVAAAPGGLRARGSIIVISEIVAQHAKYFDGREEK
jgi:uncharacterized membrane protein YccC